MGLFNRNKVADRAREEETQKEISLLSRRHRDSLLRQSEVLKEVRRVEDVTRRTLSEGT